jgi:hypothetical protein
VSFEAIIVESIGLNSLSLVELINKNIPSDLLNSLLIMFLIAGSSARIFHLAI